MPGQSLSRFCLAPSGPEGFYLLPRSIGVERDGGPRSGQMALLVWDARGYLCFGCFGHCLLTMKGVIRSSPQLGWDGDLCAAFDGPSPLKGFR
jgi:hypothetical protein